ncbi:MAG: hypothetical protein HC906_00850 [Bacteroidales bacterium]|nr:hypothetical protein [Bacteroidales bacterium]
MDLFHQVFEGYFQHHGRTEEGKKIYTDINETRDIDDLKNTLAKNNIFKNDSLLELVILKCLYDEFYSNQFSRTGIIAILDTMVMISKIEKTVHIAKNILDKITKLQSGYYPPQFKLYDSDSKPGFP